MMYPTLEKVKFVQGQRVLLKFSDGTEYRLPENVYLELNIPLGAELTEELEHRLLSLKDYAECKKKAMDLLASRPQSSFQLKQKLFRNNKFSKEAIFNVIAEMEELNYLNDEEYCRLYIEESLRLKPEHGPGKIRQKLLSKGLDRALIDANLRMFSQEPEEEYEIVKDLAHRKWKSYPDRLEFIKKKSRLYRFLAGRGFSSSVVSRVMQDFTFNGSGSD